MCVKSKLCGADECGFGHLGYRLSTIRQYSWDRPVPGVNRYQFARHLPAIQNGNQRGVYSKKRQPDEFKIEPVTDRGLSVAQVSSRLGVTTHSLYAWVRKFLALIQPSIRPHQMIRQRSDAFRYPQSHHHLSSSAAVAGAHQAGLGWCRPESCPRHRRGRCCCCCECC